MPTVTVIPSDKLIMVDGEVLCFDFAAPANLHALQWDGSKGQQEWTDRANTKIISSRYNKVVKPYVEAFEAEKLRLQTEYEAQYNSYEAQCDRIRAERDARLNACDKFNPMWWETLTDKTQAEWRIYRQALLDIPQQEGFPWDGDINKAPWPEEVK